MLRAIVGKNGGDFNTVQAAIDALPPSGGDILINSGRYEEKIRIEKDNVTLIGINRQTILTYGDGAAKLLPSGEAYGTFRTPSVYIAANNFTARNIVFENSAGPGKLAGQALAIFTNGDKHAYYGCTFLGHQDTIFTAPKPPKKIDGSSFEDEHALANPPAAYRVYFKNCFVQGDVDFIFGGATAYFDRCEIFSSRRDSDPSGYITAASTPEGQAWGYVFNQCCLTSDCAPETVYLGRPWRDHAHTAFINCYMGAHIKKEGWHNWNKPEAEKTARYEEFGSTGPGGDTHGRADWSKILTAQEAEKYTVENVLGTWCNISTV